jgi:hypothetical protein
MYSLGGSSYYHGGYWYSLNSSEITLWRGRDDGNADQMRVRIWASSRPKYDSGWLTTIQGSLKLLTHDLGGDPDPYVVDLQFKDTIADGLAGHGVNQEYYGGDRQDSPDDSGASYRYLSDQGITLGRGGDSLRADEMRVRIWIAPFADYDSGWISTAQGACATLSHDAGAGVVYLDINDTENIGRNHRFYGLDRSLYFAEEFTEAGAYWKGLEANSITVCRGADDGGADEQRVRIWQRPEPDYDSGWVGVGAGVAQVLNHNLGLDPDGMVVEMLSYGTDVNQANYGTDVFSFGGPTYEVGAYWRNLSSNSVTVVRGATDNGSSSVRVRIYLEAAKRVYLPMSLADL